MMHVISTMPQTQETWLKKYVTRREEVTFCLDKWCLTCITLMQIFWQILIPFRNFQTLILNTNLPCFQAWEKHNNYLRTPLSCTMPLGSWIKTLTTDAPLHRAEAAQIAESLLMELDYHIREAEAVMRAKEQEDQRARTGVDYRWV